VVVLKGFFFLSSPKQDARKYSVIETPGIIAARRRLNQPVGVASKLNTSSEASIELSKITKSGLFNNYFLAYDPCSTPCLLSLPGLGG